jgi:hypothetical protein
MFMMEAVASNGLALKFADEGLKEDPNLVLAAVRQNGRALRYACAALKADRAVVLAAACQNGRHCSVAALQRLAFAACFSRRAMELALPGGGPASTAELGAGLGVTATTILFDLVRREQPSAALFVPPPPARLHWSRLAAITQWGPPSSQHGPGGTVTTLRPPRRGGGWEAAARSAALLGPAAPAVAERARAQGWCWRDAQEDGGHR